MFATTETFPLSLVKKPSPLLIAEEWQSTMVRNRWPEPPEGDGRPALLIPGFLAGDSSLNRLGAWLNQGGFKPSRSGTAFNVDCMEPKIESMVELLDRITDSTGKPATIIGQSRGGVFGRALAARAPGLIDTLVTLGSPTTDQLAISMRAQLSVRAVSTLGSLGVPKMFSRGCLDGECCAESRSDLQRPLSPDLKYIGMYSKRDEVVRWQACLDPAAQHVEIPSTHLGMAMDVRVWRELAARL
ncbi:MAG: alpha/beta fold hydrolase [Solirubrobacterales bacterium]